MTEPTCKENATAASCIHVRSVQVILARNAEKKQPRSVQVI
jgi:hypothetical protein